MEKEKPIEEESIRGQKKEEGKTVFVLPEVVGGGGGGSEWTNFDNTLIGGLLFTCLYLIFGYSGNYWGEGWMDGTAIRYLTARAVRSARLCEDRQQL